MSIKIANPEHEVAYQELVALINRHAASLSALEVLAIAGNLIGKLVALQDQRATTNEMAMETVIQNLERGNKQVLDALGNTQGSG